jgi:hypothetical protein
VACGVLLVHSFFACSSTGCAVTRYQITDHRALLNFIAKNAREDVTAFIEEWARKNHKAFKGAAGLDVWEEKEAF